METVQKRLHESVDLVLVIASLVLLLTTSRDASFVSSSRTASLVGEFVNEVVDVDQWSSQGGAADLVQPFSSGAQLPVLPAPPREHCYYETFEARCAEDEVIVITQAIYGRMRFCRCVKTNFGFVGCFTNVIGLLDRKCSGRRTCSVEVVEPTFEGIRPCNMELKSYLEADYTCVKVVDYSANEGCEISFDQSQERRVLAISNYSNRKCGSENFPWRLRVQSGQRLNVTLLHFADVVDVAVESALRPEGTGPGPLHRLSELGSEASTVGSATSSTTTKPISRVSGGTTQSGFYFSTAEQLSNDLPSKSKLILGQLTEPLIKKKTNLILARGSARLRENHVIYTESNVVEVTLNDIVGAEPQNAIDRGPEVPFLIVFSAVGCSDFEAGPLTWVRYSVDRTTAEVGCKSSGRGGGAGAEGGGRAGDGGVGDGRTRTGWQLVCRGHEWSGYTENCSIVVFEWCDEAKKPGCDAKARSNAQYSASASVSQSSSIGTQSSSVIRLSPVLVALVVTGVSGIVSLCVLVAGLLVFKKMKMSRSIAHAALRHQILMSHQTSTLTSTSTPMRTATLEKQTQKTLRQLHHHYLRHHHLHSEHSSCLPPPPPPTILRPEAVCKDTDHDVELRSQQLFCVDDAVITSLHATLGDRKERCGCEVTCLALPDSGEHCCCCTIGENRFNHKLEPPPVYVPYNCYAITNHGGGQTRMAVENGVFSNQKQPSSAFTESMPKDFDECYTDCPGSHEDGTTRRPMHAGAKNVTEDTEKSTLFIGATTLNHVRDSEGGGGVGQTTTSQIENQSTIILDSCFGSPEKPCWPLAETCQRSSVAPKLQQLERHSADYMNENDNRS